MSKYPTYSSTDIDVLMEPWRISNQPYLLYAAFALSTLFDTCVPETDDEEEFTIDNLWGCRIPKQIVDRLVNDIATDFNDAARHYKPVRIWGKPYSIRKANTYDPSHLLCIFNFPEANGDYIISKDGVMNLSESLNAPPQQYNIIKEQAAADRTYLRQIIKLAEDDSQNGWDKLTDMEIIVYCWALFYNKYSSDNFELFKQKYSDYFYVSAADIMACLNDKAMSRQRPSGMCSFSSEKVKSWNEAHKQISYAAQLLKEEADDYWYDVALKRTFKPTDR